MKKGIILLMCVALFSGCAVLKPYANLKPVEKAIVSVETFSSWYYATHLDLQERWKHADAEEQVVLVNINKEMNKIRPLIIKYDKLVLLWTETNTKPDNITDIVNEIEKLMLGVIQALK